MDGWLGGMIVGALIFYPLGMITRDWGKRLNERLKNFDAGDFLKWAKGC